MELEAPRGRVDEAVDRDEGSGGAAEAALLAQREELRRRLVPSQVWTHLDRVVFQTGQLAQRLLRRPEPLSYWSSAGLLTGFLLLVYLGETWIQRGFRTDQLELISLRLALLAGFFLLLVVVRLCSISVVSTVRNHLLDHIDSVADLTDFQRLLTPGSLKKALLCGLLYGVTVEGLFVQFAYAPRFGAVPFPFHSFLVLACHALAIYGLFLFWIWVVRLGRYRVRLFSPDPSRSEVVVRLSGLFRRLLSLIVPVAVFYALLFALFGFPHWFAQGTLLLVIWLPTIGFFTAGQVSLSRLITTAKWEKLREIQGRIETLEAEGSIEEEETLDTVKRLLEYHDRIRRTPSSAVSVRSVLNFFNSLLLPVLALLLGHLHRILELFGLAEKWGLGS